MNIYKILMDLFPVDRTDVGTVIQVYQDGVLVHLQTGGYLRAIGAATSGSRVYVQGGKVVGTAPSLSGVTIQV